MDLLLYGDERQRVFLQVGTSQLFVESALASLNTTRYPNGTHGLRLRVVRKDGNYDEYVVRMVIAN